MIDWAKYTFHDSWFLPHEAAWDRELYPWMVDRCAHTHGLQLLEIGSYEGLSAVWLITAAMRAADSVFSAAVEDRLGNAYARIDVKLTCVDAWPGPEYQSIKERCLENLRRTGVAPRFIDVHALPSSQVLPGLPSRSFDFIYIDGSHKEIDVHFDTCHALRIIKPGGMILWDDVVNPSTPAEELIPAVAGTRKGLVEFGIDFDKLPRLGNHLRYDAD